MRWHQRFVLLSCCFGLALLLHSLSFARAQQKARTDPSEGGYVVTKGIYFARGAIKTENNGWTISDFWKCVNDGKYEELYHSSGLKQIMKRTSVKNGYLAPEYAMMGHLTEKADVFAYGVVAMEIIAGRPNFDESLEDDKKYLLGWAWRLHETRQTLEMLDPKLAEFDEEEVVRVINIILLCTVGLPEQRPPMSKVVSMLTEDTEMSEVDMSMWPSYVPQWQRKRK
uniref:Serine-threonine/tyrosine-protein kinase catalytic domain-containing protein n=1 Tax=Oryza punctata TaxID=4537 RepID=A0A0E0LS87_ORYPU